MSDEPRKPKSSHWRRAVALLLVVCSAVGWWYWPRGDARIVGRWTWWEPILNANVEWHFHSNGMLSISVGGQPAGHNQPWRVEGQSLLIGHEFVPFDSQPDRLNDLVEAWTGNRVLSQMVRWEIRQIDSASIRLFCSDNANEALELRRISD